MQHEELTALPWVAHDYAFAAEEEGKIEGRLASNKREERKVRGGTTKQ